MQVLEEQVQLVLLVRQVLVQQVQVLQVLLVLLVHLELHLALELLLVLSSPVQVVPIAARRFHRLRRCSWFGCN